MEEKEDVIHVDIVSQIEMQAHTKEMRSEMDRKFVKALIGNGLSKIEANKKVKEWNAQIGVR